MVHEWSIHLGGKAEKKLLSVIKSIQYQEKKAIRVVNSVYQRYGKKGKAGMVIIIPDEGEKRKRKGGS